MNTTADVRPGTVPAWALRYAYDGEEWLVLADTTIARATHTCLGNRSNRTIYVVLFASGFTRCGEHCQTLVRTDPSLVRYGRETDDLAEAHAAFDRLEAEWRERER